MSDRGTVRARVWWQKVSQAALAAGMLAAGSQSLPAEHGFRFALKKPAPVPAQAASPKPQNGFAAAILKLQADAKRRAFEGDVDGAISCAQRARKIAEASSAMLGENPECTVEAADRLVEQLMAIKSTTRRPASPPAAVAATMPGGVTKPTAFPRQIPTDSSAAPLPPPIPSWDRPLTVFEPHPLPAMAQPPAVVAGGWKGPASQPAVVYATSDAAEESLEEIVQSDERTFALLLERARAKLAANAPAEADAVPAATVETEVSWAESPVPTNETVTTADARDTDWSLDAEPLSPASASDQQSFPADEFLIVPENDPSSMPADHGNDAEKSPATGATTSSNDTADADQTEEAATVSANRAAFDESTESPAVETAVLHEGVERQSEVTATTYRTTVDVGVPAADIDALPTDVGLTPPLVYVREVESTSLAPATPVAPSSAHLAERLARWLHVPVTTVAAGLAGCGLILLGLGLSMARSALRSPKE